LPIVQQLVKRGAHINTRDLNVETPLSIAAKHGHDDIVNWLLAMGANINIPDKDGWTPVQAAARNNHISTVEQFIKHVGHDKTSIMWQLAEVGCSKALEMLSTASGMIGFEDADLLQLFLTSFTGDLQTMKELFKRISDVNQTNPRGQTALFVSARNGREAVVDLLLENGADVNKGRFIPLVGASAAGHEQTVKLLLNHGAEVNKTVNGGISLCTLHLWAVMNKQLHFCYQTVQTLIWLQTTERLLCSWQLNTAGKNSQTVARPRCGR